MPRLCLGLYLFAEALWESASQLKVGNPRWAFRVIHVTATSQPESGGAGVSLSEAHPTLSTFTYSQVQSVTVSCSQRFASRQAPARELSGNQGVTC